MNINELTYNEITVEDGAVARMLDLLLRRVFGKGVFVAVANKNDQSITFKFWSTSIEYEQIINAMERAVYEELNAEYKDLLESYHP